MPFFSTNQTKNNLMNKIIAFAARVSLAVSLFMASDLGDAIRRFISWVFDRSCDPDKHGPLTDIFTNLFM